MHRNLEGAVQSVLEKHIPEKESVACFQHADTRTALPPNTALIPLVSCWVTKISCLRHADIIFAVANNYNIIMNITSIQQYRKYIDATLLAAAITYFNETTLQLSDGDLDRIIQQYRFTTNASDTDPEFEKIYLEIRRNFKSQPQPDPRTTFLVRRFYKIAL